MDKIMKYSDAIASLESIMADIQKGNLDIDVLSLRISEAKSLIAFCKEHLYKVDAEVKKMLEDIADDEGCEA